MKSEHKFALGCAMIAVSVSAPLLIISLSLPWWQSLLFISAPSWILSWFGGVKVARAWIEIKKQQFMWEYVGIGVDLEDRIERKHQEQMAALKESND